MYGHLAVKKICSRWIPHNLTKAQKDARVNWCKYRIVTGDEWWIYAYEPESKKQSTVWVFQDKPNPTKVVRVQSTSKQMIACFFGKTSHVATVPLVQRRTVNHEWYITICLPEVFGEIRKTNKRRRIILHQDNAYSDTSRQTTKYLSTQNIELIGYLPFRPDFAPNHFFCFPTSKTNCVDTDFCRQKKPLMRSKTMFWKCLKRDGKNTMTHGSNAGLSTYIIKENTFKNNKAIFGDKLLFCVIRLKI